jgi:hypothetical protein
MGGPAGADIEGPCAVFIADQGVATADTPKEAIRVGSDDAITVRGHVYGAGNAPDISGVTYRIRLAGVNVTLPGTDKRDGPDWTSEEVDLGDFSWLVTGLVEVRTYVESSIGPCTAATFICITGRNPLTTLTGAVTAVIALAGVLLFGTTIWRLGRTSLVRAASRAFAGSTLIGVSITLFAQQTCLAAPDVISLALVPVLVGTMSGILMGGIAALAGSSRPSQRAGSQGIPPDVHDVGREPARRA